MHFKKSLLSAAVAATLAAAVSAPAQADIIDMSYDGLFTMLDSAGAPVKNTSYPYYGDATWGYGLRTQISGTMSFDTATGAGTGTVNPFNFFNAGQAVASDVEFQSIGNGLMLGNMNFAWNAKNKTIQEYKNINDKEFKKYSSKNINITGYVDDIKPWIDKAEVFIVPLFSGGGIRIKILEILLLKLSM